MPRYFFHIYEERATRDEEGIDLVDTHAAIVYAITAARSLAAETAIEGHLTQHHRIEITDQSHQVIDSITFGEAVTVRP